MTNWLLRGLAFAAAMVVLRLIQGVMINTWESHAALISVSLLAVFTVAVVAWGLLDGRDDAKANPDPDRRQDLAMTWLVAGLVAGVLSGAVAWLISLFDRALYVGGLLNELTTFAAFTALLVFAPAMAGVVTGRWLVDRQYAKVPRRHHGVAGLDQERIDTDVFAAVGAGGAGGAGADTEQSMAAAALSQDATAAAQWPTEEFPAEPDEPTAEVPEPAEEPTAVTPEPAEEPTAGVEVEDENPDDAGS